MPPATSLVYPGIDGKLVYVADSLGNKIPDFSNAGYKGGGVPLPYVPVKVTVWPVPGDNSDNVQAAIDKISAMPVDAHGFRGAVLLKMGIYPLENPFTSGLREWCCAAKVRVISAPYWLANRAARHKVVSEGPH
jgi:hypothetical protein